MALTIMDPKVLEVALTWAWKDYYEGGDQPPLRGPGEVLMGPDGASLV